MRQLVGFMVSSLLLTTSLVFAQIPQIPQLLPYPNMVSTNLSIDGKLQSTDNQFNHYQIAQFLKVFPSSGANCELLLPFIEYPSLANYCGSVQTITATIPPTATNTVLTKILDFNTSVDSYLTITDSDNFTFGNDVDDVAFTIGGWFVFPTTSAVFISKRSDTAKEWIFEKVANNDLGILKALDCNADCPNNAQSYRMTDAALPLGTWTFFVGVYNGTNSPFADGVTLYVNGLAVASTAFVSGVYTAMANQAQDVYIGKIDTVAGGESNLPFYGQMGVIFITREALTTTQVYRLFNATRGFYGK